MSHLTRREETVRRWIREYDQFGWRKPTQTILIVACDKYDYEDYPVFMEPLDVADKVEELQNSSMSSIHDVFDLEEDMEKQFAVPFCWMVPERPELQ